MNLYSYKTTFVLGWNGQSVLRSTQNQIVVSKNKYNELIQIKDSRTVSNEDKKQINKVIAAFNSKAFTNDLSQSENFKLMFKRFNDVRIELQKIRPLINNIVYSKLIATAEQDMDYLVSLSPWNTGELAGFDSSAVMNFEEDNIVLHEWAQTAGANILLEMRAGKFFNNDEPLYFSELFNFVRKKQMKVIGLIETVERIHKNGILDNT